MAKPTDLPIWDTNETNAIEPPTSRQDDGWLAPVGIPEKPPYQWFNWWMNNVYKWINFIKDKIFTNLTVITSQTEFDAVFDGTTLANKKIYLSSEGSPYLLGANIPFGSNLIIDADPGTFIQRDGLYRFNSTGTVGTPVRNIHFTKNWSFDGQGGIVTSLPNSGGSTTYVGNGGFCALTYTEDSIFECEVQNCDVTGIGGGYYGDQNENNLVIKNVHHNQTSGKGGGVANVYRSLIQNIYNNTSNHTNPTAGGGVVTCYYCTIKDIYNNEVTDTSATGGGVCDCDGSIIENVYGNIATGADQGGGVAYCSKCTISNVYQNTETGVTECDKSTITNIYNQTSRYCVSGTDDAIISNIHSNSNTGVYGCTRSNISNVHNNAATNGAGCNLCQNSTISNVHNNTAEVDGGGCHNCDDCSFTDIYNNIAGNNGGAGDGAACHDCDDSFFIGNFKGNTLGGSGVTVTIANCLNGAAWVDTGTIYGTPSTQATLNIQ